MGGITYFLPAIFSFLAFILLLRYGINKNGIIIGALVAMVLFLLTKDSFSFADAVNTLALGFLFSYIAVLFLYKRKEKRKDSEDD